ncbi:MAG TPA: hypothetical protein VM889_09590 [Candidatus Thermoplasmatota archaeon]|nr:hypothetical protein [Candidatus Thermoplasmatota archaeon]
MTSTRSGAFALDWDGTTERVRALVGSLRPWAELAGAEGFGDEAAWGPHQEPYTWRTYLAEELADRARRG